MTIQEQADLLTAFRKANTSPFSVVEDNGNEVRVIDYHAGAYQYGRVIENPPPFTWGL